MLRPVVGVGTLGVAEAAAEEVLVPTALVAVTVQEYAVSLLSPVTAMGEPEPEALTPPQVTVYSVTGEPPLPAGENHTSSCPFPDIRDVIIGGSGALATH